MMTNDNAGLIAYARKELGYAVHEWDDPIKLVDELADALEAATLTAAEDALYVKRMEAERDEALLVIAEIQSSGNECDSNDEFDLLLFAGDTFRILASHSKATS